MPLPLAVGDSLLPLVIPVNAPPLPLSSHTVLYVSPPSPCGLFTFALASEAHLTLHVATVRS